MMRSTLDPAADILGHPAEATACEWAPGCAADAAWLLITSCGDDAAFCAPHRRMIEHSLMHGIVGCTRHPAAPVTIRWAQL